MDDARANPIFVDLNSVKFIEEELLPWGLMQRVDFELGEKISGLNVCLTQIFPHMSHKEHRHSGYEEFIFGVSGESKHVIDGKERILSVGKMIYIPCEATHSMCNSDDLPASFMSVTNPIKRTDIVKEPFNAIQSLSNQDFRDILEMIDIDAILEKFANAMQLGVMFFDLRGDILTMPKNIPDICRLCMKRKSDDCLRVMVKGNRDSHYKCKYGIYSYHKNIYLGDELLGFLSCGYRRISVKSDEEEDQRDHLFSDQGLGDAYRALLQMEKLRRNQLAGAAETLSLVSDNLIKNAVQYWNERQIHDYRLQLAKQKQKELKLENALHEAHLKLLQSQVNPHFLYNALNTIAHSALLEGAEKAAQVTYALSNLLRAGLGKENSLNRVSDELHYVKDYVYIQNIRFANGINLCVDVEEAVMEKEIPFMTLLVFVENAIVHGFADLDEAGMIKISGHTVNGSICLEVEDNGNGIPIEVMERMNHLMETKEYKTKKGIGILNVYKRLKYYFGENFQFEMLRKEEGGSLVRIVLK